MSPWRAVPFRRLWYSSLAASGAQGMERTLTAWLVIVAGGGAFAVGVALAVRSLPSLILGLAAGTVADRGDRRRQLLAVATASLLVMAAFGWYIGGRTIHPWHVIVIALAAGCIQVFDTPARQALVLDTVTSGVAQQALALNALASRLASALGAFAAGALISRIGLPRCYFILAATYAASAALLLLLRIPQQHRSPGALPPFSQAMRDAARLLVQVPAIRLLTIAGLACNVLAFSYSSALPIFTDRVLRAGSEGLGTLNAAVSIGGTIAVAVLSFLPGRVRREPLLSTVFLGYGFSLMTVAATRSLPLAVSVLLVTGLCAASFDILQQTLMQLAVPAEQRGRAVGLWVLSIGSAPAGHLETGALAATLGAPGALLINGALTALAAATLLVLAPAYRWAQPRRSLRRGAERP